MRTDDPGHPTYLAVRSDKRSRFDIFPDDKPSLLNYSRRGCGVTLGKLLLAPADNVLRHRDITSRRWTSFRRSLVPSSPRTGRRAGCAGNGRKSRQRRVYANFHELSALAKR